MCRANGAAIARQHAVNACAEGLSAILQLELCQALGSMLECKGEKKYVPCVSLRTMLCGDRMFA